MRSFTLALLLVLPLPVPAQSPYRLGWDVDGPVLGIAGVLGGAMVATNRHLPGLTPEELEALSPEDVNAFDRGAIRYYSETASSASTALEFALIGSPLLLFASERVRDDFSTAGAMYLEMLAFAAFIPQIAKNTVDRPRPYAYNESAPLDVRTDPSARRSFFSQHTTFAFASAVFLSTLYGDYFPESDARPFVWIGSLSAAAAVGVLRYTSGNHFPTDILLGAALGAAIGAVVPMLHRTGGSALESSAGVFAGGAILSIRYRL